MGNIALSMIVKDEPVDRLAMLVEYLRPVVSRFVLVDTGSAVDDTELWAKWRDVTVGRYEWNDNFADARNATLPYFGEETDWILHLDADELPTYTMMKHLEWIKDNAPERVQGYQFWTQNFWAGEVGVEAPYHWHARLFRRGSGRWYKAVHEQVEVKDKKRWYREEVANSLGYLVHADKDAYLIHSKPRDTMERANEVYSRIGEGPNP